MSGTMKASLLLTLEDQLSGGLTKLMEAFDKLAATADALGGKLNAVFGKQEQNSRAAEAAIGRFEGALKGLGETAGSVGHKLDEMWSKVEHSAAGQAIGHAAGKIGAAAQQIGPVGGVAAGFGVLEPVKAFADYENTLRHIAITEGKSGDTVAPEIARLTALFREDAQKTGQSSESIAKAYYDLVTTGIPANILDKVIGAHSQAATAYNISPEALGPAVGALLQNFKVPEEQIGAALSAMAQAAKEGRFKVEDFSRELPGVSGVMSLLGMKGREGADYGFASLETIMKNSSDPSQASAGFVDALRYITDNAGRNAFKREGIDLPAVLAAGAKDGKNPLDTVLDLLTKLTAGMDPVAQAEKLGALLHNQQAALAIQALLQHRDEANALKTKLDGVDGAVVKRDFDTAVADPITQTRLLHENLEQITRTIGEGFVPILTKLNDVLGGVKDGLAYMNEHFPGLTHALEGGVGALITFISVIGVLGFVIPNVTAGFKAVGAAVELLGAGSKLIAVASGLTAVETAAVPAAAEAATLGASLTALAGPLALVVGAVVGAKLLADNYLALRDKMPADERHATDNAAAGVTDEWELPPPAAAKPTDVNVHITHDPGLAATATSSSPNTSVTTQASPNRVVGRD